MSEWEQRTTWARVLDGADVPEGNEFHRCDEQADTFDGTERWTNEAYDGAPDAATLIASDTHLELADAECSAPPVWWPESEAVPVDKLTAYAGVREISRADAARKLGLDETSVIESLSWVFSYPGLDKVAKAAKTRGVNPWGLLGAVMSWVAADIPPEVTTLSEQEGKGTFNLFVALCGEPGAGKGRTMQLGSELVRRGAQGNFVTDSYNKPTRAPVGSPEGMISVLRPRTPDEDDDAAEDNPRTELARVIFVIDEMNRLYGERRTQESTQEGTLLSMWSNENVGVLRKKEQDTLAVEAWSYRVCFLVGAQAKWVHRLASETSAGLAQRWLYLPAATTHVERPQLGRKRNAAEVELPTIDVPAEVWNATEPVVIDNYVQYALELQDYFLRKAGVEKRPIDPFKVHRAYNQARVAAALSVITRGRLEVSPEAWHLAAAVMDVSDLTRERISREYEHRDRQERINAAADRAGIHDDAVVKAAEKRIVRVLKDNGGHMSGGSLRNALSRPQREVSDQAVANLRQAREIKVEDIETKGNKKPWRRFSLITAG
ncbi:hypothetical protein [Corynebacterium sp. c24Ua_83]|uniref:hypothetical protein n=1 Tax=Corynebacterium sp. c24Ua_83 TaxID=3032350 RepID=UPI0032631180